jgi:acyl dehydratase
MAELAGRWLAESISPAVCASDIRRWAIAVYWPEQPPRLFWDSGYAATTLWDGIVAPEDFNPFAWPALRKPRTTGASSTGVAIDVFGIPVPQRGEDSRAGPALGGMNAGRADEFGARIRPGDAINSRERLADWKETTTRFGPSLFATTEIEWTNQRGELVRRRRQHMLRYHTRGTSSGASQTLRDAPVPSEFPAWSRQTGLEAWNRYAAVNDEFVDMHMSDEAGRRAGNPEGAFGMGNLRYAYLLNALREWFGDEVRVLALECSFRALNRKGDTLTVGGTVASREASNGIERVELTLDVTNQHGESTCPARATIIVAEHAASRLSRQ